MSAVYENSNSGTVASVVTVSIPKLYNSGTVTVLFYDSEALDNEVEPSAGELRLSGRLVGYSNYTQLAKGVLPCSSQCIATYRGRLNSIQCVPSGIVGATHYKVTVIAEDQ
jgi:hypothetical protein